MMNYDRKNENCRKLKKELEGILDAYENKHGIVDFNTQKSLAVQKGQVAITAQFILGILLALGIKGTTEHFINSYVWFARASENNHIDGARFKDGLREQLSVTQQEIAQNRAKECSNGNYTDCF